MSSKNPKQARRPDVPSNNHVAHLCNPQRVKRNAITQVIEGVFPDAFALRVDRNELYLSTQWMESLGTNTSGQFKAVVKALRDKGFDLKSKAAIARLNVGLVVNAGAIRSRLLRVRDRSSVNEPGYSGIYGMPSDNSDVELLALFADECCIEVRDIAGIDAQAI